VIVDSGVNSNEQRAVDPATCQTVWQLDEADVGPRLRLWKAGTNLIQRTEFELVQLKAGS
jgi:hypothetical protein